MWSLDEHEIRNDKDVTGTTVRQALVDAHAQCAAADEAAPLFTHVVTRLDAVCIALQDTFAQAAVDDRQRVVDAFVAELVKCAGAMRQYSTASFAARVLQHKKLAKTIKEIHEGTRSVYAYLDGGLDRLVSLTRADKAYPTDWQAPFDDAVQILEQAVAAQVDDVATLDMYKKDALLALEAATLLCNAQKHSNDRLQWEGNAQAQNLRDKLQTVADSDDIVLPEWFLPESEINYQSRRFAHGSYGAVHHGTWGSGTKVVVKVLLADDADKRLSATLRKKFIEEATLWSKMSHPYVLKLFGACHVTAPPFFVCEDATKGDLKSVLAKDTSRLWRLLFQSALAIEYLHGKKIIHGDLKLNNILVGADGYARVADFGLSRFKKPSRNDTFSRQDSVVDGVGALRWRAPEALDSKAQYASDVYSFALCIIEAISGETPYAHVQDDDDIQEMIRDSIPPDKPDVMSDEVWALIQKMTVPEPKERATIKQVIAVLKQLANKEDTEETERTSVCQICSTKLDEGSSFCSKCQRKVMGKPMSKEVGPILSKDELPRVIELVTLSDGQHEHKAPNALRDYMFGQPDHQKYVFEAGAIPVLAKVLLDEDGSTVKIEALTALGCTMVANKKIQNAAKFENVIEMLKDELRTGVDRMKIKAVLVLGYLAHGNREIRDEICADEVMRVIRTLAAGPVDDDLPIAATKALMFLDSQQPATAG